MAYAQWISITIEPKNYDVTIKNVTSDWGKFYSGSLKSNNKCSTARW